MNQPPGKTSVQLYIDRLVVDAPLAPRGAARVLQAAIELELARLLTEEGVQTAGGAVERIQASSLRTAGPLQPAQFGRHIARSIHGAIQVPRSVDLPQKEVRK